MGDMVLVWEGPVGQIGGAIHMQWAGDDTAELWIKWLLGFVIQNRVGSLSEGIRP